MPSRPANATVVTSINLINIYFNESAGLEDAILHLQLPIVH